MAKKAYVRYAKNKAVAGSLILADKAPKVGVWKEVPADLCCGGGCPQLGPFTFSLENTSGFGTGSYIALSFSCFSGGYPVYSGSSAGLGVMLQTPVIVEPTLSELVDIINTNLATQGISAQLVEGVLQVTVSNTDYISTSCPGSFLTFTVSFTNLP